MLILLPAHISFACYVAGIAARSRGGTSSLFFRLFWFAGAILLAVHSGLAFAYVHGGDHAAAFEHTARRTAEFTGWNSGVGLYANEVMLVLWLADAFWALAAPASYLERPAAIDIGLQAFFAFMFFFATIAFGTLPAQILGGLGCVVLAVVGLMPAREEEEESESPSPREKRK